MEALNHAYFDMREQFNSFIADNPRMRLSERWHQAHCFQGAWLQAVAGHKHYCSQTNLLLPLHGHCFVRLTTDYLLVGGLRRRGCPIPQLFRTGFCANSGRLAGGKQKKLHYTLKAAF